jgi:hypothetical protein
MSENVHKPELHTAIPRGSIHNAATVRLSVEG